MKYKLLPIWVAILSVLIGCGGVSSQTPALTTIPMTVLLADGQCQSPKMLASAIWIRQPEGLDHSLIEQIKADHPDAIPWDRDTEGVLVIHMGRQPTGGYRLSLVDPILQVQNGIGFIKVSRHRPAIGAIVSQVISSPCLVVKFPWDGLKSIHIYDQSGRPLDKVTLR